MARKLLSVLAIGILGLVAFGGTATAEPGAPYPAPQITVIVNVTVNITIINVGGTVIFSGTGFDPGEAIDVAVSYSAPSGLRSSPARTEMAATKRLATTADSTGAFSTPVTLTQVGTATLTATGATSGKTASLTVQALSGDDAVPAGTTGGTSSNTYTAGGSGSSSSTALASTGASVAGPIVIGAAALFAGLAMLFFGTRGVIRRKTSRSGSAV